MKQHPFGAMSYPAVSREAESRLAQLVSLVLDANREQNLIAPSTEATIGGRHVADSLQILRLLKPGLHLDVGSGAGFPGLAVACVRDDPTHLVEPRARRADFLRNAAEALGLRDTVVIHQSRVERVALRGVDTITARAVAPLNDILAMTAHVADENTRWVLHKGRTAAIELEQARKSWQGEFTLIASLTDPSASIVVAEGVRRRPG